MKRIVKRLLIRFGVLAGLLVIAAVVILIVYSIDEDPPNDADLRITRVNVPDDENAFTWFVKAAEKVKCDEADAELLDAFAEALYGPYVGTLPQPDGQWDGQEGERILSANSEALDLIEKGLTYAKCEAPVVEHCDSDLPWLRPLSSARRTMALQSITAARSGKAREALSIALDGIRLGRLIEQSRGHVLTYLCGRNSRQLGSTCIMRIVMSCDLHDDALAECERALAAMEPRKESVADALRREYMLTAALIEDKKTGELSRRVTGQAVPLPSCLLRVNATKRLFAELRRQTIASLDGIPRNQRLLDEERTLHMYKTTGGYSSLIGPNTEGKAFFRSFSAMDVVVPQAFRTVCFIHGATRLIIALKRYELHHGSLPGDLNALVPEFIDAIPLDSYSGKPLLYDAKAKAIYSVGKYQDNAIEHITDSSVWFELTPKKTDAQQPEPDSQ